MNIYIHRISTIQQKLQVVSAEKVWRCLCASIGYQSSNQNVFFPCRDEYISLVEAFSQENKSAVDTVPTFTKTLNSFFNTNTLNVNSEFAKMLQAFLSCYPDFIADLNENITVNLQLKPYQFPPSNDDADQLVATLALGKNYKRLDCKVNEFVIWGPTAILQIHYFNSEQLASFIEIIKINILSDSDDTRLISYDALIAIKNEMPELDLKPIATYYLENITKDIYTYCEEEKIKFLKFFNQHTTLDYATVIHALIDQTKDGTLGSCVKTFKLILSITRALPSLIRTIAHVFLTQDCLIYWYHIMEHDLEIFFNQPDIDFQHIIPALLTKLQGEDKLARRSASLLIGMIANHADIDITPIVTTLVTCLADSDDEVSSYSAFSLLQFTNRPSGAMKNIIPQLFNHLDKDGKVKEALTEVIGTISAWPGVDLSSYVNQLITVIHDNNKKGEHATAIITLSWICKKSGLYLDRVIPLILNFVNDGDNSGRLHDRLIQAIEIICERPDVDVSFILSEELCYELYGLAEKVADVLRRVSKNPQADLKTVIPALMSAIVYNEDGDTRHQVGSILKDICDSRPASDFIHVIPYLLDNLKHQDWVIRNETYEFLNYILKKPDLNILPLVRLLLQKLVPNKVLSEDETPVRALVTSLPQVDSRLRAGLLKSLGSLASVEVILDEKATPVSRLVKKRKRPSFCTFSHGGRGGCSHNFRNRSRKLLHHDYLIVEEFPYQPSKTYAIEEDDLMAILILLIKSLGEADLKHQAISSLAKISLRPEVNKNKIIPVLKRVMQNDESVEIKIEIIKALVIISEKSTIDAVDSIAFLSDYFIPIDKFNTTILDRPILLIRLSFNQHLINGIAIIANKYLPPEEKHYCLYGLLMQKYLSGTDIGIRFSLLETIAKISQQSALEHYLKIGLKVSNIVNLVLDYADMPAGREWRLQVNTF
jgi:hypothetical protein